LYKSGTHVSLKAAASSGQAFLEWSGDASGSANPLPLVIAAPMTVTGNFIPVPSIPMLLAPTINALVISYQPTFDWSDSLLYLDHYQIQVATELAFTHVIDDQTTGAASTYTSVAPLPANSTLYWRVRAIEFHGLSRGWTGGRLLRTAHLPPDLVSPVEGEHALTPRPSFSWNPVAGATGYTIHVSKNNAFTLITTAARLVAVANYTPLVNLPPGKVLYWRVRANGPRGPSAWSEVRSFLSANAPGTPAPLTPLSNALTTTPYPTFDWNASTLPTGTVFSHYGFQLDDNADLSSPYIDITISDINGHAYAVVDPWPLLPNTKYYWHVQACNTDGECSTWSIIRSLRSAILPPMLVDPGDTTTVSCLRPAFDWTDVIGSYGYTLQVSKNSTFTALVLSARTAGGTNSQYTPVVSLPANLTLYWRARANGLNGPSLWSAPRTFISPNPPFVPIPSSPLPNALVTDYGPTLVWSSPIIPTGTAFSRYQVQVATDAAFTAIARDMDGSDYNTPEYTASPDLNPNTKYYWRVRAWNTFGHYSVWSAVRYFRSALSTPAPVSPADTAAISLLRPSFTWNAVPGAVSYTIQVSKNNTFTPLLVNATTVKAAISYKPLLNLPVNIPLYWRVRANGANGPSLWSPVWSITVVP
jgi:hypothetical protein